MNAIRVSNSLDQDQAMSNQVPNCFQMLSAEDIGKAPQLGDNKRQNK